MALDSLKLSDALADVASGVLQLPDFQREWKWDDERIRALIATVTLDYPLGVVMALQTNGTSPSAPAHSKVPRTRRAGCPICCCWTVSSG